MTENEARQIETALAELLDRHPPAWGDFDATVDILAGYIFFLDHRDAETEIRCLTCAASYSAWQALRCWIDAHGQPAAVAEGLRFGEAVLRATHDRQVESAIAHMRGRMAFTFFVRDETNWVPAGIPGSGWDHTAHHAEHHRK
jgi:hypothetical protein